ncbi:uncharacterized protein EV420DRAFT_1733488 [Desarmillaria tabescens]|uniref:BTB domain-containing protein n=1 Tax=Armillaria tabescens TaxID=1929756 RepID=A0AA39JD00_ARMTA|nr:uncharacterized protein EV420DRAFT_1733488 [Desarmillaria tabescens]KAK0439710.1 hypothetical protein EV420DRAFT_1733488 [Desarmillaria tabescens]
MLWSIRDPPSPVFVPSLVPEGICYSEPSSPKANTPNLSPTPAADPPSPSFPRPSPPSIRLDLVGQEQWSTNPLQVTSTFIVVGDNGFQPVSSPAYKKGGKWKTTQSIVIDPSVTAVHAWLQSGLAGFPPEKSSIRASFRRDFCVLVMLEDDREECMLQKQDTVSLGHCDITLPLGEPFIDLVITVAPSSSEPSSEVSRTISEPMSKAIRASLDGSFLIGVKLMVFTRKYGETSACNRRAIYASSSILKGRSAFLESYINGPYDDPPPGVCQYPYDEDSDLPCDIPQKSDRTTIRPQPEALSRALSPVDITGLDTVQPAPLEFRGSEKSSPASIFDSPPLSTTSCKKSPAKSCRSLVSIDALSYQKSDVINVCGHEKAESPVCNESMGRLAEVTNHRVEDYLATTAEPQQKAPTSLPHLVLVNDVAFRTFRALMVYMYTKEVAFIPLKSSGGRSYNVGDACSPKSMYRLAVKANHEGLKKHAFDNLRSQLGPANIITEIYSKFTRDHPEIFDMELTVLLDHFTNSTVRGEWEKMIDLVASGRLPHGSDILKKVTRVLRT